MLAPAKPISSFLPITSIQALCYQALTDTFAQRDASISFILCNFRTLLIVIGGGTPLTFLPPTVNAFGFSCLYSIAPAPKKYSAGVSNLLFEGAVHATEPIWHSDGGATHPGHEVTRTATIPRTTASRSAARAGTGTEASSRARALLLASQTRLSPSPSYVRRMEQRQSPPHGRCPRVLHDFLSRPASRYRHRDRWFRLRVRRCPGAHHKPDSRISRTR